MIVGMIEISSLDLPSPTQSPTNHRPCSLVTAGGRSATGKSLSLPSDESQGQTAGPSNGTKSSPERRSPQRSPRHSPRYSRRGGATLFGALESTKVTDWTKVESSRGTEWAKRATGTKSMMTEKTWLTMTRMEACRTIENETSTFVSEAPVIRKLAGHHVRDGAALLYQTESQDEPVPMPPPFKSNGEEMYASWTHNSLQFARLAFLFSHGVTVIMSASSLRDWRQTNWFSIFIPAWIGDALCLGLMIFSWFASCPYIRLCRQQSRVCIGRRPSFLTEILPEILLSVIGVFGLIFIFIVELNICRFLMSAADGGAPRGVGVIAVFATIVSCCCCLHGIIFQTSSSAISSSLGVSIFATVIIFLNTHADTDSNQAWILAPALLAVVIILLSSTQRFIYNMHLLKSEEKCLRVSEMLFLVVLLASVLVAMGIIQVSEEDASRRSTHGEATLAGIIICLLAMLRGRLSWWESKEGTLEERAMLEHAVEMAPDLQDSMIGETSFSVMMSMTLTQTRSAELV